jgi:hypothetical protein
VGRGDWVPAGRLRPGERLAGLKGPVRVLSLTLRSEQEPVYNLEVEGEHCYRVGEQGVLVHNSSLPYNPIPIKENGDGWAYAQNAYAVRQGGQHKCRNYSCNLGSLMYSTFKDVQPNLIPQTQAKVVFGTQTEHAEYQLLDPAFMRSLPNILKGQQVAKGCTTIIEIFTERSPCDACGTILATELPMYNQETGVPDLYYVVAYGSSDAQLGAVYGTWFKGA